MIWWWRRWGRTGPLPVGIPAGRTGVSPVEPLSVQMIMGQENSSSSPGCLPRSFPVATRELWRRRRHLPHWERAGEVYFVTVRFRRGRMSSRERRLVLEACLYWQGRKAHVYGVVVMPNHLHMLLQPLPLPEEMDRPPGMARQCHSLVEIMHSVKSYTAHAINARRGTTGPLWGQESFDRIMRDQKEFLEKLRYIINNPVKAGLIADAWDYPFLWIEEMGPPPRDRD